MDSLIKQFKDEETSVFAYIKAYVYLKKYGESKKAKEALLSAISSNFTIAEELIDEELEQLFNLDVIADSDTYRESMVEDSIVNTNLKLFYQAQKVL